MLHAMRDSCLENKAEVALGFDGLKNPGTISSMPP